MPDYRLISADSHINEPPNLWKDRLPKKFQERAPKMVHLAEGDAWILEGALDPINFGLNACGGVDPDKRSQWMRWEDIRKGGYVPSERLKEQKQDGVDAEILYPTPRISRANLWNNKDVEFHLACIRAYNDWISEYSSHDPTRLLGLALMPCCGIEATVAEFQRVTKLPGIVGTILSMWPSGSIDISPSDNRFWAAAQEAGVPVNIHVGFATGPAVAKNRSKFSGELRFAEAPVYALELIMGMSPEAGRAHYGTLDRFPKLKIAFIEVDCGWVPYVKEQFDNRFERASTKDRPPLKLKPSEYFDRNMLFAYITDRFGIQARQKIGVNNMMWSSDYPHAGTDWPNSWKVINQDFRGIPASEKQKILVGNAAREYKLTRK